MKTRWLTRSTLMGAAFAVLFGIASTASGGRPPLEVTVFDASEKVAFKGTLASNATFATHALPAGRYVVQFNTKSGAVKSNRYLLVVSAGAKKVIASDVAGELFNRGGAAMRVDVAGGMKITGAVAKEEPGSAEVTSGYRMIDGKRYLWIATELGSNLGGRWVDASLAPVSNLNRVDMDVVRKAQDHGGEGSMIRYGYGSGPVTTAHGY